MLFIVARNGFVLVLVRFLQLEDNSFVQDHKNTYFGQIEPRNVARFFRTSRSSLAVISVY